MSTNPLWYDAPINAITALLNSGTIKIYTTPQPALDGAITTQTLLATLTFGGTAFGTSSGGTATANTITSGTAAATGTAFFFALCESGGTIVETGLCGTSGADLNMSTTSIVTGATVSCSAFTIVG